MNPSDQPHNQFHQQDQFTQPNQFNQPDQFRQLNQLYQHNQFNQPSPPPLDPALLAELQPNPPTPTPSERPSRPTRPRGSRGNRGNHVTRGNISKNQPRSRTPVMGPNSGQPPNQTTTNPGAHNTQSAGFHPMVQLDPALGGSQNGVHHPYQGLPAGTGQAEFDEEAFLRALLGSTGAAPNATLHSQQAAQNSTHEGGLGWAQLAAQNSAELGSPGPYPLLNFGSPSQGSTATVVGNTPGSTPNLNTEYEEFVSCLKARDAFVLFGRRPWKEVVELFQDMVNYHQELPLGKWNPMPSSSTYTTQLTRNIFSRVGAKDTVKYLLEVTRRAIHKWNLDADDPCYDRVLIAEILLKLDHIIRPETRIAIIDEEILRDVCGELGWWPSLRALRRYPVMDPKQYVTWFEMRDGLRPKYVNELCSKCGGQKNSAPDFDSRLRRCPSVIITLD